MALPKSSLMSIQDGWIQLLADFRAWLKPESELVYNWKIAPFAQSIRAAKSTLVDDVEALIGEYRQNKNADVVGTAARIPVLLTAVAQIEMPPDASMILGKPYFIPVVHPNDPDERIVQMRVVPRATRAQLVFLSTNTHDISSIADQFCAYMTDDDKRRFKVHYDIGGGLVDAWDVTVMDNSLSPSQGYTDEKNLRIVTVDVTMVGFVPQFVGLGVGSVGGTVNPWDKVTDNGYNGNDGAIDPNGTGESTDPNFVKGGQDPHINDLIVTIDIEPLDQLGTQAQLNADPDTGDITVDLDVNTPP